jgi:hypothetical protein
MDQINMKVKLAVITLVFIAAILACNKSTENINENKIFYVDMENCKTSIDLKLSDLIDSCWLVPLETTNESILSANIFYFFISDDYILIIDPNGVYKYSSNGKFVKKIINSGRGPHELSINPRCFYYEKGNLLFIEDYYRDKDSILCYDVKSETFLPSIKKCFSDRWGDFIIYNDSLIMGSFSSTTPNSNPYAIFFQDLKGNFISGIHSKRKFIPMINIKDPIQKTNETLQRMLIYTGDQLIHVKYTYDDTLFALKGNQLLPYLIARINSTRIGLPNMLPKIGDKLTIFEKFENPGFIIFKNQTFEGEIPFNGGAKADYKTAYFFLNKSNGKYGEIKSYTDDFIGKIQSSENETMVFPSFLPNNKLYILYYPNELLQKTSTDLVKQRFPKSICRQLSTIKSNLSETDNPVLLIGVPKKRI